MYFLRFLSGILQTFWFAQSLELLLVGKGMVFDVGYSDLYRSIYRSLGVVFMDDIQDSKELHGDEAEGQIESSYSSISSAVQVFFAAYYRTHYTDEDYLMIRTGQYSYYMYVGEVEDFSDTHVKFKQCDVISYVPTTNSYDSSPYYTVLTQSNVLVDTSNGEGRPSVYAYSSVAGGCSSEIHAYQMAYKQGLFSGGILVCACISMLYYVLHRWFTRHDRKS